MGFMETGKCYQKEAEINACFHGFAISGKNKESRLSVNNLLRRHLRGVDVSARRRTRDRRDAGGVRRRAGAGVFGVNAMLPAGVLRVPLPTGMSTCPCRQVAATVSVWGN